MSKGKGFTTRHQGTLLMCLAVASVIAGGSYFVGHIVGEESTTPHQQEVTPNEETQNQPDTGDTVQAGYYRYASGSGTESSTGNDGGSGEYDHLVIPKRCYLVVAFDDEYPVLDKHNTLTVPMGTCIQIAEALFRLEVNKLQQGR